MREFRFVFFSVLSATCLCISATSAQAGIWSESADGGGDAGETPGTAQVIDFNEPLDGITGAHVFGGERADLFKFVVTDVDDFSASLDYLNSTAPYLYLFDESGLGVAFASGTGLGGGAPAVITGTLLSGPGVYLLGATNTASEAVDASNAAIWTTGDGISQKSPDGPGASNPVADFNFDGLIGGNYTITLTGAAPVPEPSTWLLAATAAALLVLPRYRRR